MGLWLSLALCAFGFVDAWASPWDAIWGGRDQKKQYIVGFVPGVGSEEQLALCKELGIAPDEYIDDVDVVIARPRSGPVQVNAVARLKSDPKVRFIEEDFYANWLLDASPLGFMGTGFPTAENAAVLSEIHNSFQKLAAAVQRRDSDNIPWGVRRVNAPAAWEKTRGQGVRVAVIDTGIDCGHPDLFCSLDEGVNFVDPKQPPMDDNGHGTHVSGTIAGWEHGKYAGVAPMARVVAVKVLDARGSGRLSEVVKGISWAAHQKIPIANMSLGTPQDSIFLEMAVKHAIEARKMTVIAAAGNGGMQQQQHVSYPGAYPKVIAVAASGYDENSRQDFLAPFSSRGNEVAFIAPGVDVWSTAPGGKYAKHSGTSMAVPHVSGLAALAAAEGARGPEGIYDALRQAAASLPGMKEEEQGHGMIDAAGLLSR